MVRRDVAGRKIAQAWARLRSAEQGFARPRAEFLADAKARDLACFYLFLAIQECMDLAAHWVADAGWEAADDGGSAFDVLASHGLITADLAQAMRAAAGLRNRIAHDYAVLSEERLYEEFAAGAAALKRFLAALTERLG